MRIAWVLAVVLVQVAAGQDVQWLSLTNDSRLYTMRFVKAPPSQLLQFYADIAGLKVEGAAEARGAVTLVQSEKLGRIATIHALTNALAGAGIVLEPVSAGVVRVKQRDAGPAGGPEPAEPRQPRP